MPPCKVDVPLNEGDVITVGDLKLDVWHTPGHTPGQLAFKMGNLLFCGDNIYKDSCVGVIDAHHGSNLPDFIAVARAHPGRRLRVPAAQPRPGLPPGQPTIIQKAIDRLTEYQHMADFGTCAVDWPLLDEWEADVTAGRLPKF